MNRIFLSYRRADSAQVTGRIYDGLISPFGKENVFKDVYSIRYGTDLRKEIEASVSRCNVMLAIIGKNWLTIVDDQGRRRLDDSSDYVRNELKIALSLGIRVIPLLVEEAKMPKESELPECLRQLAFLSAAAIRPDPDFHHDIKRLIVEIDPSAPIPPHSQPEQPLPPPPSPLVVATRNVVEFGSRFVTDFLQLAGFPRGFVTERVEGKVLGLANSILFFAVSILIGWMLEVGSVHEKLWRHLAESLVFSFGLATAYGGAISLAWWIVRGKADARKMFTVHYYYWGMMQIFMAAWFMAVIGAVQAGDSVFYSEYEKARINGTLPVFMGQISLREFQQSGAYWPVICVAGAGCVVLVFWMWNGWGAYRVLNGASQVRSICAAILFVLLCLPVTVAMTLIAIAGAAHSS